MSRFIRFDESELTYVTGEQMEPYILKGMEEYERRLKSEYGDALLSPEEATEVTLRDHHIVLINGQYLLGYSIGSEFFSKAHVIQEEFLIRVAPGDASLCDVLWIFSLLKHLHKVDHCYVGTRAAHNQAAIRRLYSRYGGKELLTIMRF
ncbi:hypothetical protein [Endozoicomonas ascidiicola]|uniref:hypothetical protein n=1 Tax=Endozoicomonas ascidiicola TaxID=1698521 RepID=UPI00082DEB66|nr:hypothetical protein [Endozoicomonas ascidiicola]